MSAFLPFLMQVAILAYAMIGGVFLAFSDFIMRSLSLARGAGGVEVMQAINRMVVRRVFIALFLGTAAVSGVIAVHAATSLSHPAGTPILLAGLVYLFGCFGVTVVFNVPLNEALARMDPSGEETRAYWTGTYLPRWTFWNTVRTLACGLSAALLLFGLSRPTDAPASPARPVVERAHRALVQDASPAPRRDSPRSGPERRSANVSLDGGRRQYG